MLRREETTVTYATSNARYWERDWISNSEEVHSFARDMVEADYITEPSTLLDYFEKPYKWSREHTWWVANDRPDSWETWFDGETAGFKVGDGDDE